MKYLVVHEISNPAWPSFSNFVSYLSLVFPVTFCHHYEILGTTLLSVNIFADRHSESCHRGVLHFVLRLTRKSIVRSIILYHCIHMIFYHDSVHVTVLSSKVTLIICDVNGTPMLSQFAIRVADVKLDLNAIYRDVLHDHTFIHSATWIRNSLKSVYYIVTGHFGLKWISY